MVNTANSLNVVSIFSGCGGLDLGVANAGSDRLSTDLTDSRFNFVWSNDVMEHACRTLADNFDKNLVVEEDEYAQENSVFCGDVRDVNFANITDKNIDVVMGGFPCQDFSILRGDDNRQGVKVERGRLYLEFVRSLAELQPQMFVAENVKGLVSANDGKAYERILKDFTNLSNSWSEIEEELEDKEDSNADFQITTEIEGYTILHSDVVDFSTLGVPQGRERLVLIGLRDDLTDQIDVEDISETIEDNLSGQRNLDNYPITPLEAFEGDTLGNLDEKYKEVMEMYEDYVDVLDSERAKEFRSSVWPKYEFDVWADYFWRNGLDKTETHDRDMIDSAHTETLTEAGYFGESLEDKTFEDGSNEEMREQSHVLERLRHIMPDENHQIVKDTEHHVSGMMSNIYRRTHPLQPSPTIIASGGGGTWGYHYERERGKLTNRERARIQAFPDDFLFDGTNSEVRKQIGNAVPPLGAKKVGEEVLTVLDTISD